MALVNKKTKEYLKISKIDIFEGVVVVSSYKDRDTRLKLTDWDNVIDKHYRFDKDILKGSIDAKKNIKDNLLTKLYEKLKEKVYIGEDYYDDI